MCQGQSESNLHDDFINIISDQRGHQPGSLVEVHVHVLNRLREGLLGVLVQVRHSNPRRQRGVVRVGGGHGRGGLGGELIELAGGDALVDPRADLLRDEHGVAVVLAEAVAELLEARRDLVEVHRLLPPVPLHHVHVVAGFGPPAGRGLPSNTWCAPPPPSAGFEAREVRRGLWMRREGRVWGEI
jgi:hypothetical protein